MPRFCLNTTTTAADLRNLRWTLDRLGKALADVLIDPDDHTLEGVGEDRAVILDRIISFRERIEEQLVRRQPPILHSYRVSATGILLFDATPEERVRRAEHAELHPEDDRLDQLDAELSGAWDPREDEHPVGVGAASESDPAVAELASIWTPGGAA